MNTGFADRISAAAAAKKARLKKFTAKPAIPDSDFVRRQDHRAAELAEVRSARAEQRAADLAARAEAKAAEAAEAAAREQADLKANRLDRKSRKLAQKADANARRQDRREALEAYGRSSPAVRAP
jgi:hypothetical protein